MAVLSACGAAIAVAMVWPAALPRGLPVVAVLGALLSWLLAHHARRVDATDRVRALGPRRSWLPRGVTEPLEIALARADIALDGGAAVQVWLMAAIAAGCLAYGLDAVLAPVAIGAVLLLGPIALHGARHRGARRCAVQLPVALELVASELRTGGTVIGALESLGSRGIANGGGAQPFGGLTAELARIARRCDLGAPLERALASWVAERSDPGVGSAAGALAVAASTGGRSAEALDGLASSLRDRTEIAAEARALSAQARLSAIVVGSLPIAYLAACALLDSRQVRVLTGTPFGLGCLVAGLVLEALAAVWIRALLSQEG